MDTPPRYRGRFAPSPTGPLHFGSLLAALGSWLLARRAGGEWLVRIEDLDPPREIAGAAERQLRDLSAFGLVSDAEVIRQSDRAHAYQTALDRLLAAGLAFECHCSRADLAGEGGLHRACVPDARRSDPAVRLRIPDGVKVGFHDLIQGPIQQDVGRESGDVVLRRTDGLWAYQLAVVVDDAAQGITDVARGADLLDSTPRQIHLQRILGLPTPCYAHLPLVLDPAGQKLSKSTSAMPVDPRDPLPALRSAWRALGQVPGTVAARGAVETFLRTAVEAFDPALIPRTRSVPLAALHNDDASVPD